MLFAKMFIKCYFICRYSNIIHINIYYLYLQIKNPKHLWVESRQFIYFHLSISIIENCHLYQWQQRNNITLFFIRI